jgi:hypothetical protein
MRKLILAVAATVFASTGCCRWFCDDHDRRYYAPAAVPVSAPVAPGR